MCAPCKVIINQGFRHASELADVVAQLATVDAEQWTDGGATDDALYELAEAEVEAIERVKACARRMARRKKAPERWLALLARMG